MSKIKTGSKNHHKYRPKGVNPKTFEKVHWPYLPIVLAIVVFAGFGLSSGRLQAAAKHPTGKVLDYATNMSISGLLADTNAQRTANGLASFSLNAKLDAAAQNKANDMATRNYWSHDTPDGNPPWVFVNAQGYAYQKLGENLAAGFSNEQSTINGWMASPPHRANLLDPAFSQVGFGFANNANYTAAGGGPMTIVVAFYGQPTGVPGPLPHQSPPAPQPVAASRNISPPAPPPVPAQPTVVPPPQPQAKPKTSAPTQPTTTLTPPQKSVTLSFRTTNAQEAFAKMPASSFATGVATFVLFAAGGFWLARHLLIMRRVLVRGESYIITHPLIDIGLVFLAAIAYLLGRTAGLTL